MQQLTTIANSIITFINTIAVPLVFAVAFIVFLFGVFRYWILGAANEDKRKEGRQLIIYSIIGFAVMIVVWGLVNLIVATFGFSNTSRPALPTFGTPTNTTTGTAANTSSGTVVPARPPTTDLISPSTLDSLGQQSKVETQPAPTPTPSPSPSPTPDPGISSL